MTDYRNFRPGHDLRSQLGLKNSGMSDERRVSLGLPSLEKQFAERMDELVKASVKPLDPAKATPKANIIHLTINSNDIKLDADGQRIHDEILRMFSKRGLVGTVVNGIKIKPDVLLDARAIHRLMPYAGLCVHDTPVEVYVANHPGSDPLPVKDTDITRPGGLTSDIASALLALSKDKQIQGTDASLVMNVDEAPTLGSKWANLAEFAVAGTLAKGMAFEGRGRRHYEYLDVNENEDTIERMLSGAEVCDGVNREGVRAARQKFDEAFSLLTKALHGQ